MYANNGNGNGCGKFPVAREPNRSSALEPETKAKNLESVTAFRESQIRHLGVLNSSLMHTGCRNGLCMSEEEEVTTLYKML
jgi:hypothetical protein